MSVSAKQAGGLKPGFAGAFRPRTEVRVYLRSKGKGKDKGKDGSRFLRNDTQKGKGQKQVLPLCGKDDKYGVGALISWGKATIYPFTLRGRADLNPPLRVRTHKQKGKY